VQCVRHRISNPGRGRLGHDGQQELPSPQDLADEKSGQESCPDRIREVDNGGVGDTEKTQTDIGINYWPHEDVVVKFDIQQQDHGAVNAASEQDGFNIGIGYQF